MLRFTFLAALTISVLPACTASHEDSGVTAINLRTGEIRTYASEAEVPDGWTVCEGDSCPDPLPCAELEEASCLARADCEAHYAEFWPPECEGDDPPAFCDTLPFVGCADRPDPVDECSRPLPLCELMCPPGTHHPIDDCGRERTCECVPDDEPDPEPACEAVDSVDRSCASDADCDIGMHMVNCCGGLLAIGIRATERARFDALETACEETYPACGCYDGSIRADDGGMVREDPSAIGVTCVEARCTTFVRTAP